MAAGRKYAAVAESRADELRLASCRDILESIFAELSHGSQAPRRACAPVATLLLRFCRPQQTPAKLVSCPRKQRGSEPNRKERWSPDPFSHRRRAAQAVQQRQGLGQRLPGANKQGWATAAARKKPTTSRPMKSKLHHQRPTSRRRRVDRWPEMGPSPSSSRVSMDRAIR